MKEIVEFFSKKDIIFKKLESIDIKKLKSRKKIEIYSGIDIKSNYIVIFDLLQKSRFVLKNAKDIEVLFEKLKLLEGHNYKKKFILLHSPLCSKAKKYLQEMRWRVYVTM